jgi:hypothetical protein
MVGTGAELSPALCGGARVSAHNNFATCMVAVAGGQPCP